MARDSAAASKFKLPSPGDCAKLSGVDLVNRAGTILDDFPGRPRDDEGRPGGLIELPQGPRPIIIGDLHANRENLAAILDHSTNRADLEAGRAVCVIIGDVEHDDRTGYMKAMETSVAILEDLFRLICRYPGRVCYLRGNHDTFDDRLRKSGIAQGTELRAALTREHGGAYADAVGKFFESLPVFVIGKGFVITHAGPPRGGLVREEIVNIRRYPEKYHQLLWNRVNEFHGTPSPKEYGEKDLRLVLELLDLPPDTHFIVGHNPLWNDGNRTGVWKDVIGIRNHHILYSGSGSRAPYFTAENGELVVKMAAIEKTEVYSYG